METIHLQKSTEKLSIRNGQLIHSDGERELDRYPVCATGQIAVYGNGQITTQAVKECLKEGIRINYFTMWGKHLGRLEPDHPKNIRRRLEQYRLYLDPVRRVKWVRSLLTGKLQGELVELRRLKEQGYDIAYHAIRKELKNGQKRLERSSNLAEMRGIEGNCARKYYGIFEHVLPAGVKWGGRKYHPAGDAVNAVLSLIYSLTLQDIRKELENRSLDPHCGFLHEPGYGGAGLDYDLLELFRATWCDHTAIRLMNDAEEVRSYVKKQRRGSEGLRLPAEAAERIVRELREKREKKRKEQAMSFSEQSEWAAEATLAGLTRGSSEPDYRKLHPER